MVPLDEPNAEKKNNNVQKFKPTLNLISKDPANE